MPSATLREDSTPMADDSLNSFRQRFAPTTAPAPSLVVNRPQGKAPYAAFAAKDKVVRLDVRCGKTGLAHAVAYSYLLNLSYNRKTYSEFFLTVSGLTVMVKGTGLRPIIDAIKLHTCEFIQEYDPEDFEAPHDASAPFIESIRVEMMSGPLSEAAQRGSKS